MNQQEAEAIVQVCLEAVSEQYVLPLTLALGTLTAVACRDPSQAKAVAAVLRQQADSCSDDVSGKLLLQSLAGLAARQEQVDPAAAIAELRTLLSIRRS